jgi:tRNA A37 threonylcarbamoyltransferase TsaD
VASNLYLKENFEKLAQDTSVELFYSAKDLATDNALMIALTAAQHVESNIPPTSSKDFIAFGGLSF